MRIVTRAALKRLAVLFVVLVTFIFWAGCKMVHMPLKSFRGPLPALTEKQAGLRDELRKHVEKSGGEIGERNVFRPRQLRAAADFVESIFTNSGYRITRQSYNARDEICDNLIAEIHGKTHPNEIIVVGAHYDSVSGSPGANDNGSAVASLLALARMWSGKESA